MGLRYQGQWKLEGDFPEFSGEFICVRQSKEVDGPEGLYLDLAYWEPEFFWDRDLVYWTDLVIPGCE